MTSTTAQPTYGSVRAALAKARRERLQAVALFAGAILATALIEGLF